MKITVYTINDCKFSQTEKEYLKKNNVEFEEKNLETNRDFLTEMLAVSNNFAGTPVTKIEKDSGESIVLKGFTQEEFDKVLGIKTESSAQPAQTAAVATTSTEMSKDVATAEAAAQPAAVPETKPEETATPPTSQDQPAAGTPAAAPEPMVVESLSLDGSSDVTPSNNNEMPVPAPVVPITPAQPAASDAIGPISLTGDQPTVVAEPAAPMDTQAPVVPTVDANAAPQQSAAPQPANDALSSVLQNLQNQVKSTEPAQDGQKQ